MNRSAFVLTTISALTVASPALAEVEERRHGEGSDYYAFTDDLLSSDVGQLHAPRILVHGKHLRAGLVRPRVSFVTEMHKSVEAL